MPFSPKTLEEKPYNICIRCERLGKQCDGPNFFVMELPRLSEWCRIRKDYLHSNDPKWTNAYIAEQANMSKVSVDRFLSGNVEDIKMSTIARILQVLVDGSWGQYPCGMAGTDDNNRQELIQRAEKAEAECKRLQAEEQKKIDFLKEQIKFNEEQLKEKDKQLEERYAFIIANEKRKNRIIGILATALSVAVLIIIISLVINNTNLLIR